MYGDCNNIDSISSSSTMKEQDLLPHIQLEGLHLSNRIELESFSSNINHQPKRVRSKSDSVFNSNKLNLNV